MKIRPPIFSPRKKDGGSSYIYKKGLGNKGERIARRMIRRKGFKIIESNFTTKYGEIDIIAERKDLVIFVEVKTRTSDDFGNPEDAVTYPKQKKISQTAKYYVHKNKLWNKDLRFDIIAVKSFSPFKRETHWIEDAFRISFR
ncbi:MAG: YraN family protein [Acidobacteria bacterium]|nr:YraN family protein [Acidobacteriota bacterium]